MNDDFTYEKAAIERWLQRKKTSPVTGDRIDDVCMIHNVNLRKLIRDHVASTPSTSTAPKATTPKATTPKATTAKATAKATTANGIKKTIAKNKKSKAKKASRGLRSEKNTKRP